jgi:hypothetical protein
METQAKIGKKVKRTIKRKKGSHGSNPFHKQHP